jgi:hypothetical protein
MKPYLARDPFFIEQSLLKKVDTVELLLRMKHPDADNIIGELIDSSDFQTTYSVLKAAFGFLCHRELEELFGVGRSRERFDRLLERARTRHGELAELLLPVFDEEWRQNDISRRRAEIKGEDHRFFLALLLNVPNRKDVLRLVQERFPERNAVELIVEWVRQLAATNVFGSREPNVLNIENFDDTHLRVFRGLLEGLNVEEIRTRMFGGQRQDPLAEIAAELKGLSLFKVSSAILKNGPKL